MAAHEELQDWRVAPASHGPSESAHLIGRSRSTDWRELKRNMVDSPKGLIYCVCRAQQERNGRLRRIRRGSHYGAEATSPRF